MNETTCPICDMVTCVNPLTRLRKAWKEYYPLPQPDLTNLREVWEVFIQNTDINKQNKLSFQDGGKFIFNVLQAVKELLKQEEK